MFTIEKIQRLNELEMSVYQYVIQHQNAIPYMRIRELAAVWCCMALANPSWANIASQITEETPLHE